jgi:hypothetical protein
VRPRHVLAIAGAAALSAAAVAIAAHKKVDPSTVPVGFFTAHSQMSSIPASAVQRVLKKGKADAFLEHARMDPGEATRFVTHPGPVFVMVAKGSVSNEEVVDGDCRRKTYIQDRGFVTRGIRTPHRMTPGAQGAELYLFFLAPRRTGPTEKAVSTPSACE